MKAVLTITCCLIAAVVARPEPPANQYLEPYSTTHQDAFAPPSLSDTYGAPSPQSSYSAPSSTYGAPASTYRSPASTYSAPAARSTFNIRRGSSGSGYARSSLGRSYAAPSATAALFSSPSTTYGAPSALSSNYGAPSALSSTYGAPSSTYGAPGYARLAADDMSEPANYEFGYSVNDAYSGSDFAHQESRQDGAAWGSYSVLLPDGRKQIVEYEADHGGFRPKIRYEETGVYARSSGGPY